MGFSDHALRSGWILALSSRVREIPARLGSISDRGAELRGKIGAVSLLLGSLVFGSLAADLSRDHAIHRWRMENLPPERVWTSALGSYSFRRLEKTSLLHRVMRTLPIQFDPSGAVWSTADLTWIVVMNPQAEAESGEVTPWVFSRRSEQELRTEGSFFPRSGEWHPAEPGWPGFQDLLKKLERLPAPKTGQTPAERPKNAPWRDSRALVF